MPSERILNKLFEIAQENTSEEVNYNDFVKDVLNSADLTLEDKIYNAEDEYLRNLLALAKHDGRIFGEYKNGKFVISESVIKSAKKETQRQFDANKIKTDSLKPKEVENDSMFESLRGLIDDFSKLSLEDKLTIMRNTDKMTDEEFDVFSAEMTSIADNAEKEGVLSKEQADNLKTGVKLKNFYRRGEYEKYIACLAKEIERGNQYVIDDIERISNKIGFYEMPPAIRMELIKRGTFYNIEESLNGKEHVIHNKNLDKNGGTVAFEKFFTLYKEARENSDEEMLQYIDLTRASKKSMYFTENMEGSGNSYKKVPMDKINLTYETRRNRVENAFEIRSEQIHNQMSRKITESISVFDSDLINIIIASELSKDVFERYKDLLAKLDKKRETKGDRLFTIADEKKEFSIGIEDREIEERKASEVPGLEDLAVFDRGFEDLGLPASGDFMSAFEEIGEEAPVTDFEFAQIDFETTEIAKAREEMPSNATSILEEEPELEGESDAPHGITVEEINSDAVTTPKKQEEIAQTTRLQLDLIKSFSKGHTKADKVKSYLGKLKDIKSQSYAGIDINNINEINDIA